MGLDQQSRKEGKIMDTERVLYEDGERRIVLINEDQIAYDQLVDDMWFRDSAYCDTFHPDSDGRFLAMPGDMLVKILDQNRTG